MLPQGYPTVEPASQAGSEPSGLLGEVEGDTLTKLTVQVGDTVGVNEYLRNNLLSTRVVPYTDFEADSGYIVHTE